MADPNPRYQLYNNVEKRPPERGPGYPIADIGRKEVRGTFPGIKISSLRMSRSSYKSRTILNFINVVHKDLVLYIRSAKTFVCEGLFTTPTKTSYAMCMDIDLMSFALLPGRLWGVHRNHNLFQQEEGNPRSGLIGIGLASWLPPFLLNEKLTLNWRICPKSR